MDKILIKNGTIYDGSGNDPYKADLLVGDGKIQEIGRINREDALIIDAVGKAVTPGFIDMHRHCDLKAMSQDFGEIELAQGITTTISGSCGLTPFPSNDAVRQQIYDYIEPCLGKLDRDFNLNSFESYLRALEEVKPPINIGGLIGSVAVKIAVKGFKSTPFTNDEMDICKHHIKEAMQSGAFGLSMGIMYVPECYSSTRELVEFAKVAAHNNGILTCHIRGEGDSLISSIEEVIEIAKHAEIPLNISHFKAVGLKNWNCKLREAIDKIEAARYKGMDITVDFYPYTGGSTTLLTLIPPIMMMGETKEALAKLSSLKGQEELRESLNNVQPGWDNLVTSLGWERVIISSVTKDHNKKYLGQSVKSITEKYGYKDEVEFVGNILADESGKVGIIIMSMSQEDVDTVASLPYSMVISDSLYSDTDNPHPRLYGSFARIIREYVNERKVISMQEAISKMTYMPAHRLGIRNRGLLKTGFQADINIFNPCLFSDHATFEDSKKLCTGMEYSLINGNIVWSDEAVINRNSAAILRKNSLTDK